MVVGYVYSHNPTLLSQGSLDLIIFLFLSGFMLMRWCTGSLTGRHGAGRGRWKPGIMYLPVLFLRWMFTQHKDWVKDHREHLHLHEHDHHHRHHHNHHHHHSNPSNLRNPQQQGGNNNFLGI